MRGMHGIYAFVFAVTLGGAACADPLPIGGTASFQGELGDMISMKIDLDDGRRIEILRDPMTLIGKQIGSGVSKIIPPDDGQPESMRLVSCKSKSKDCTPFDGNLIIESLNNTTVKGYVTMPESVLDARAFSAQIMHEENPLLTGGLVRHAKAEQRM